ncbi:MAG: pantoate--beta-alanine ligase [Cyclobacteriaceae bacterium]|nr:pantoate--beta-alanine ligase [Cyclobacteriaceae bacterium]
MQIFKEIGPLKAFLVEKRKQGNTLGFVATMGALHEGHLKLIRESQNDNSVTICSIFVNPSQFNNPEDLQKYPRTLEKDIILLEKAGCDALFCPEVETMYHQKSYLRFDFGHLDKVMEGQFRPGHFSGVALVVSKLLHIVEPHVAYFGQKDWQQFAIIRQLVSELQFNVALKSIPTLREASGLAMSSRNARLTNIQREKAALIHNTLLLASDKLIAGDSIPAVKKTVTEMLEADKDFKVEYFEIADSENLTLLNNVTESAQPILCIAVFVGDVRLIDNMFL